MQHRKNCTPSPYTAGCTNCQAAVTVIQPRHLFIYLFITARINLIQKRLISLKQNDMLVYGEKKVFLQEFFFERLEKLEQKEKKKTGRYSFLGATTIFLPCGGCHLRRACRRSLYITHTPPATPFVPTPTPPLPPAAGSHARSSLSPAAALR